LALQNEKSLVPIEWFSSEKAAVIAAWKKVMLSTNL